MGQVQESSKGSALLFLKNTQISDKNLCYIANWLGFLVCKQLHCFWNRRFKMPWGRYHQHPEHRSGTLPAVYPLSLMWGRARWSGSLGDGAQPLEPGNHGFEFRSRWFSLYVRLCGLSVLIWMWNCTCLLRGAVVRSTWLMQTSVPSTCNWKSVVFDSFWPNGLHSPWNSLGQNTEVGSLSLLQGIFTTQGSNSGLPHCRRILYQLSHKGS